MGAAQASLEAAIDYGRDRKQFGHSITSFQHTQFKLADMAAKLMSARLMVRRAASLMDERAASSGGVYINDPEVACMAAMAKRWATDLSFEITDSALQLHGGYGYLLDYPVQQWFRDCRVHRILEGTNEVMQMIVAKHLLGPQ